LGLMDQVEKIRKKFEEKNSTYKKKKKNLSWFTSDYLVFGLT
jgi:hypothetical protein